MSSELNKLTLNNEIVLMRHDVRKARVHLVHKITRTIKKLRSGKGSKQPTEKDLLKADKLVEEIRTLKTLEDDFITKTLLIYVDDPEKVLSDVRKTLQDRVLAKMFTTKIMETSVSKFRKKYPNWREDVPALLKNMKRKSKKKVNTKDKRGAWKVTNSTDNNRKTLINSSLDSWSVSESDAKVRLENWGVGKVRLENCGIKSGKMTENLGNESSKIHCSGGKVLKNQMESSESEDSDDDVYDGDDDDDGDDEDDDDGDIDDDGDDDSDDDTGTNERLWSDSEQDTSEEDEMEMFRQRKKKHKENFEVMFESKKNKIDMNDNDERDGGGEGSFEDKLKRKKKKLNEDRDESEEQKMFKRKNKVDKENEEGEENADKRFTKSNKEKKFQDRVERKKKVGKKNGVNEENADKRFTKRNNEKIVQDKVERKKKVGKKDNVNEESADKRFTKRNKVDSGDEIVEMLKSKKIKKTEKKTDESNGEGGDDVGESLKISWKKEKKADGGKEGKEEIKFVDIEERLQINHKKNEGDGKKEKKEEMKVVDPFFMTNDDNAYLTVVSSKEQAEALQNPSKSSNKSENDEELYYGSSLMGGFKQVSHHERRQSSFTNLKSGSDKRNGNFRGGRGDSFSKGGSRNDDFKNREFGSSTSRPLPRRERRKLMNVDTKETNKMADEKLHPSWEAKRRQSCPAIPQFSGKKIVFDD